MWCIILSHTSHLCFPSWAWATKFSDNIFWITFHVCWCCEGNTGSRESKGVFAVARLPSEELWTKFCLQNLHLKWRPKRLSDLSWSPLWQMLFARFIGLMPVRESAVVALRIQRATVGTNWVGWIRTWLQDNKQQNTLSAATCTQSLSGGKKNNILLNLSTMVLSGDKISCEKHPVLLSIWSTTCCVKRAAARVWEMQNATGSMKAEEMFNNQKCIGIFPHVSAGPSIKPQCSWSHLVF